LRKRNKSDTFAEDNEWIKSYDYILHIFPLLLFLLCKGL